MYVYALNNRSKIYCIVIHSDTDNTICIVVRCQDPPSIYHGNMTTVDTVYNTNITYTCEGNYRLEYGDKQLTIRCEETGEWTYKTLSCDCKFNTCCIFLQEIRG